MIKNIHWHEAYDIIKRCQLVKLKSILVLMVYYGLSIIGAVLDGVSTVLLVGLVTGEGGLSSQTPILVLITKTLHALSVSSNFNQLYFVLIALFLVRVMVTLLFTALDGYLEARLRRRIQEAGFTSVLRGDWEFLRNIRVGKYVGAVTEEATNAARYVMSIVRAIYSLATAIVLVAMAMSVSTEVTLLFVVVGIPTLIVLKYLFGLQARIAELLVAERQGFYAAITERFHGLFQIKVEGNADDHIAKGLAHQEELTRLEIKWWYLRAFIYAFNVVIPVVMLLAFYGWASWNGYTLKAIISLLAGVGLVGARALTQANQLTANIGNITGYAGSIPTAYNLFTVPGEPHREMVTERIQKVELKKVSYQYDENAGIEDVTQSAQIGKWLAIMGPSGSGKTTLANLIAGIYRPLEGNILYHGISGHVYNANEFRPRVGYVTQDIHLFHGTVRENLIPSSSVVDDDTLWDCLNKVGADGFVKHLGGLDAVIAESGRSLSGGERRRLGIARVLTSNPDILILDEVTVGLDEERKKEIVKIIQDLSLSLVVIVITHDIDIIKTESDNVFSFNA